MVRTCVCKHSTFVYVVMWSGSTIFILSLTATKDEAEVPEKAAKEKHEKAWEGKLKSDTCLLCKTIDSPIRV